MSQDTWMRRGFVAAGLINLGGVLLFSKLFTNEALTAGDPIVMSRFGLVVIMLWGLAYIAVAGSYRHVPWLVAVFAVEKAVYGVHWLLWLRGGGDVGAVFAQDALAGVFFAIYGPNDLAFMAFFAWVFVKIRR